LNNKAENRGSSGGGAATAEGAADAEDVGMMVDGGLMAPVPSWRTAVELQFVDVPLPLTPIGQAQQQLLLQQQLQQQVGTDAGGDSLAENSSETADDAAAEVKLGTATAGQVAEEVGNHDNGGTGTVTQHGAVLVQAVQCDDSSTCQVLLPANLHSALQQLGLSTAVGVIRLMRASSNPIKKKRISRTSSSSGAVDRRTSIASGTGDEEGEFGEWLVIRILLGVPLSPLPLCRQVCQNLRDAQCLSPAGQVQQKAGQQQLQQHLLRLVSQYGAAGLMNGAGLGSKQGFGSSAAPVGATGGGEPQGAATIQSSSSSSRPPGPGHEQLAVMGTLPAVNILFDGMQLQPVELQLQGTFNAAYNLWWSP
jgi:hypothetical protein